MRGRTEGLSWWQVWSVQRAAWRWLGTGAVVLVAGALAAGELSHAVASRLSLGRTRPKAGDREAIIVLGYPSAPDGRPHPLQRWRATIAARSISPEAGSTVLICTGAPDHTGRSEASVLAGLLAERGVPDSKILLEEQATSTWQNIEFCLPLISDADVVKIASNSLHAWRARRFLRRQHPGLANRLVAADDYRFGERWWLKTPLAVYEAVGAWREWRHPRLPG